MSFVILPSPVGHRVLRPQHAFRFSRCRAGLYSFSSVPIGCCFLFDGRSKPSLGHRFRLHVTCQLANSKYYLGECISLRRAVL